MMSFFSKILFSHDWNPGLKFSYELVVSDISDNVLVDTVKHIEKSGNVVGPMPFDIFKTGNMWYTCW